MSSVYGHAKEIVCSKRRAYTSLIMRGTLGILMTLPFFVVVVKKKDWETSLQP